MNKRLNIKDIAAILAEATGRNSNELELFLKELIALISEQIFIDKLIVIKGLGTFKIISIEKRESIDVNTKERITIPGHYKLSFTPEKSLRELVNKPFSFFESIEINEDAAFAEMNTSADGEEAFDEKEDEETEDNLFDTEENELEKEDEPEVIIEAIPEVEKTIEEDIIEEIQETPTTEIVEPENVNENTLSSELPIIESVGNLIEESPIETLPEDIVENKVEVVSEPVKEVLIDAETITPKKETTNSESAQKVILYVLLATLLLVIGVVGYINRDVFFSSEKNIVVSQQPVPKTEIMESDSINNEEPKIEKDSIIEEKTVVPEKKEEVAVTPAASKEEDVIAKVKMKTGSRLTLLALEYYGNKIFWVYIYDYNKSVIKNPNQIPIGIEVSIPNPKLYGIDSQDAESVKKAAARQTELLAR